MGISLDTDIKYLKGVGEKRAELFKKLSVVSIGDLLSFYPRSYIDMSNIQSIDQAELDSYAVIRARVLTPSHEERTPTGKRLYQLTAGDGQSVLIVVFWNNKYAADALEVGREYIFYGRVTGNFFQKTISAPYFEPIEKAKKIRAIYPLTKGLNNKTVEQVVSNAIKYASGLVTDYLPADIKAKHSLLQLDKAVVNIHIPESGQLLSSAKTRLIFDEFFLLSLGLKMLKGNKRKITSHRYKKTELKPFTDVLPFSLTFAQKRAVNEAVSDLCSGYPMNRLLQGDVGSGKTIVAAALCYYSAQNNYQTGFMVPTEILALQHYETLKKYLGKLDIKIALLTGSTSLSEKEKIYEKLADGSLDIVVGTHALISDKVRFKKLGLVITDEQHRFGVAQRSNLAQKGHSPHILVMSATPIPRTLALIVYGDLDISILDELPPGRKKVNTYIVATEKRAPMYGFIREHLDKGLKAYIVCPMIEDNETGLISTEKYARDILDKHFKKYKYGLLHGKMKPKEKDKIMDEFAKGDTKLLVSTTVVEVGLDVPEAVIMVIENAERFGLSQLHQLRGRVGRGSHKSYCFLVSDSTSEQTRARLEIMTRTNDGFIIAEEDLKIRGPGDFFGSRQHGLPELKMASFISDIDILRKAQLEAELLLETDPLLDKPENKLLRGKVFELISRMGQGSNN